MGTDTEQRQDTAPWPQQLLDSEWLLALAAVLFFTLSYIVLGLVDLLTIPSG
ncbi:MAG: hypothetical protein ABEJ57_03650 [Halobacteriaceae archaeon]